MCPGRQGMSQKTLRRRALRRRRAAEAQLPCQAPAAFPEDHAATAGEAAGAVVTFTTAGATGVAGVVAA